MSSAERTTGTQNLVVFEGKRGFNFFSGCGGAFLIGGENQKTFNKKIMIKIPITNKTDAMKLFNLFQKKEKQGLELAKQKGLITEEEFLRISAQRAADALDKFVEKKGRPKHQPTKNRGSNAF